MRQKIAIASRRCLEVAAAPPSITPAVMIVYKWGVLYSRNFYSRNLYGRRALGTSAVPMHVASRDGGRIRHETRRGVSPDGDRLGPCGDPRLRSGCGACWLRSLARLRPRVGRQAGALR